MQTQLSSWCLHSPFPASALASGRSPGHKALLSLNPVSQVTILMLPRSVLALKVRGDNQCPGLTWSDSSQLLCLCEVRMKCLPRVPTALRMSSLPRRCGSCDESRERCVHKGPPPSPSTEDSGHVSCSTHRAPSLHKKTSLSNQNKANIAPWAGNTQMCPQVAGWPQPHLRFRGQDAWRFPDVSQPKAPTSTQT